MNLVDRHASHLTDMICEMKFLDKDQLFDFIKTSLNVLESELINSPVFSDMEKKFHHIESDTRSIQSVRIEIESQLLRGKSELKEGKKVDTAWLARCNHAFRQKGLQIQNNISEMRRLKEIIKRHTQAQRDKQAIEEAVVFKKKINQLLGSDKYQEIWDDINKELPPKSGFVKSLQIPNFDLHETDEKLG